MIRRKRMQESSPRAAAGQGADVRPPLRRRDQPRQSPALRFSPTAWAKLLFLRDIGDTEVGGFGIAAADDLLYVEDVVLVRQTCSGASVAFDDQAVAELFDQQVDAGRRPAQFARLWVHTHPGNFATPSQTDEKTFSRVFGRTDWAVMFILAREGQCFARLRFHVGPGGDLDLPICVDYSRPFAASDHAAWEKEYAACVQNDDALWLAQRDLLLPPSPVTALEPWEEDDWWQGWGERLSESPQVSLEPTEAHHAI